MSKRERWCKQFITSAFLLCGTVGVIGLKQDTNVIVYIIDIIFSLVMYYFAVDEVVSLVRKSIQNDYFDEDNDFEKRTKKSGIHIPKPSKLSPMPSTGAKAPPFRRMTDPPMPRKTKPLEPLAPKR